MVNTSTNKINKEVSPVRRILVLALIAVAILALTAAPALAEGYNDPTEYTRATGYESGPHGGYNSTTNKCNDCHSTHYASGSYVLLRANSREAACDFCHVGGGGSSINIQMDNTYDTAAAVAGGADAVVDTGNDRGTGVATPSAMLATRLWTSTPRSRTRLASPASTATLRTATRLAF